MKAFVALLLLASVVTAKFISGEGDEFKQALRECAVELNVSMERVEDYTDEELSKTCFIKCLSVKAGWFDERTGVTEGVYQRIADQNGHGDPGDTIRRALNRCADNTEHGSNSCEWASRSFLCIKNLKSKGV